MRPRFIAIAVLLLLICFGANAQAHFETSASVKEKTATIQVIVSLDKGWYLYQQAEGIDAPIFDTDLKGLRIVSSKTDAPVAIIQDKALNQAANVYTGKIMFTVTAEDSSHLPAVLPILFHGYISDGTIFLPVEESLRIIGSATKTQTRIRIPTMQLDQFAKEGGPVNEQQQSWLQVLLLGFLGGLVALFTPCVFPMIPVTVSFFSHRTQTKQKAVRLGVSYGLCILFIYLLASLPFHLFNVKPEILNNIATSVTLNLVFFVVFVLFALSFFGVFTIQLPSFVANKADGKSNAGTLPGIFFLALTLVIVSFSCTGPILGTLLVGSASGGAWLLSAGCGGFGLALGLPFALFAIFPGWLSRMPKSGNWLSKVKVSLAFIELALALKFLSNADLVKQWGILKREVLIGAWMLIGLAWFAYLMDINWLIRYGKVNAKKGQLFAGMLVLGFVYYLGTGLTGSRLTLLSGFAPPTFYSVGEQKSSRLEADVINDYEKALTLAKAQHKKVLIDFTGWACVNCRKMEEQVWTDPAVSAYIREHFILVSLYVDDKKELPSDQQIFDFISTDGTKKDIRSIGDRYAAMEAENLNQVTQPLYAVINENEELQQLPVGYTPNPSTFLNWLNQSNKK